MGSGKVLLGVLAGVAVGATLGILLAPDKGENTRKKISDKGDEYADDLKEKFGDLLDLVINKLEGKAAPNSNTAESANHVADNTFTDVGT